MSGKESIIKAVLEMRVRPVLQVHGGDISFVDFDEATGVLTVKLQDACECCPHAKETLNENVGTFMKAIFPEIKEIRNKGDENV